ncbi:MAG: DUF3570 domain-containing protein [Deltaproteobacteria bacterium]
MRAVRGLALRIRHRITAIASVFVLLVAGELHAENRVASNLSLYTDDDATDVVTSVTRISADPWEGGTVEASYLIDIISSASVDLVSSATGRFDENRHALGGAVTHALDGKSFNLNYGYSQENDYVGHGIGAGANFELAERNATLGVSYALELSQIGRADDPTFEEGLTTHAIDVNGSQILTPWLVVNGGYALALQNGYLAKPYRYARLGNNGIVTQPGASGSLQTERLFTPESGVPETHPDFRMRNALYAGIKAHIVRETAAELRYRFYVDNWALSGHTIEALGHLGWNKNFGARFRYRFYAQGAASFYQFDYATPQRYMTRDRELSPLTSHLVGLKLFARVEDLGFLSALGITAKADLFRYDYSDFPLLPTRQGFVLETGVEAVF